VDTPPDWPEILHENRFLAARDGIDAVFIDGDSAQRVPAREQLERLLERARPHAQELGCEQALDVLIEMAEQPGAECQRESATISGLGHPLAWLAQKFED
jgi:carboxylate-amine ligase